MGHFEASAAEAALDVEALVGLAAVEDALVAADALGDVVEGLDQAQAELFALLVLGHGDVLDVAYQAQPVYELALHDDGARADDRRGLVAHHEHVVRVVARRHEVVPRVELVLRRLADRREDPQGGKKAWREKVVKNQVEKASQKQNKTGAPDLRLPPW